MTGFRGDKNKTIIFQNRSGNTPVVEIADDSFGNSPTEEAILTEGIAYIGRNAFSGCNKLHQVVLPISIEEIEDSAFENCSSLKSISLPMALKTIGDGALKGTGLRTIEIPKSVFWLGDGLVADCQSMEHVTIPENIGRIPDHMFEGCINLKKVELHEKLEAIGERAFFGCNNLSSVTLNEGLLFIGESAFSNNKALTEINIPATVQKLADKCLDRVKRIHVNGYLPKDFFKSCILNSEDNYSADNIYDIVEITDGTYKLFIPRYIAARDIAKMNDTFYMRKFSDITSDNKFVESMLDMAEYTETKQNLAIAIYKYNNSSSIKTYLRRTAVNLTNRLLDSKKENELVDFLKLNIMSLPSMKKLLADDRIHQFTSAEAYLLNAISQSDGSSKTFKL